MNLVQSYVDFWKNYANFNGRATRTQFWIPAAANCIVMMFLWLCGIFLPPILFLVIIFSLATLVPNLALIARRLHDTDRGTIQILWALLPILGGLYLLVVCGFIAGQPFENQFGPDPHTAVELA